MVKTKTDRWEYSEKGEKKKNKAGKKRKRPRLTLIGRDENKEE